MTHTPEAIAAMIDEAAEATENWRGWGLRDRAKAADTLEAITTMLREVAAERDAWRDKYNALGDQAIREVAKLATECGRMDVHRDAAVADLASVSRERDRIAAMVEKLRGYAVHDERCGLNVRLMPRLSVVMTKQCTCGLSEVLKESENG